MSRILVIDDSPSALEAVAMTLAQSGHQVSTCSDGKHARRILGREVFDLVLTDIYMPEEDGLQLIQEVRRRQPKLPVVAMSGGAGLVDMLPAARLLGACQILRKPFSGADLLAAVEVALTAPALCPAAGPGKRPPSRRTGDRP